MARVTMQYKPDYAAPPGWALEERLDAMGISQAEFARRCGRSPKLISQIIAGAAPVEPESALQFERALGVDASIWLGIESDYRLHLAKERERAKMAEATEWAGKFPVAELVKRGAILKPTSKGDAVQRLLEFFGVASVRAWEGRMRSTAYAYRHSPAFKSEEAVLAVWLRLGELEAEEIACAPYSEARFKQALLRIREITAFPTAETLAEAQRECQESGVALAIVKPLPQTALSGASRWLNPRKAAIQLTARHLSDDQLWFSLFHEAAHLLLHSKKQAYVDATNPEEVTGEEAEANKWAADFLIPPDAWSEFVDADAFTAASVELFAEEQGICPGIVVGRLQHERYVRWNRLNQLKVKLRWGDAAS